MTYTVIGSCSLCGGDVTLPQIWHGVFPPKPTCQRCGATAAGGPVIPMNPSKEQEEARRQYQQQRDDFLKAKP